MFLSGDAVVCFQQSGFSHKTRVNKIILGRKKQHFSIGILVCRISECSGRRKKKKEGKKERENAASVQGAVVGR